jgi:hypothetical protein
MWRSLTASSCRDILIHGLGENLVTEVAGEEAGRVQVHLATEEGRQLTFHVEEGQARDVGRLELDQDVDVARKREVAPQHRPEERQPLDVVAPAEVCEGPLVDGDLDGQGGIVADSWAPVALQGRAARERGRSLAGSVPRRRRSVVAYRTTLATGPLGTTPPP